MGSRIYNWDEKNGFWFAEFKNVWILNWSSRAEGWHEYISLSESTEKHRDCQEVEGFFLKEQAYI